MKSLSVSCKVIDDIYKFSVNKKREIDNDHEDTVIDINRQINIQHALYLAYCYQLKLQMIENREKGTTLEAMFKEFNERLESIDKILKEAKEANIDIYSTNEKKLNLEL